MSDDYSKLIEKIHFHYQERTDISKYMDIRRAEIENFEPISYLKIIDGPISKKDTGFDFLAKQIGTELANLEFSKFVISLKKVPCKTEKTTLDNLSDTLDQTFNELHDLGFVEQLFMPLILKNEIRKRKQSIEVGIDFSVQNIHPILANELGHSQIIFANKNCFGKTYPLTVDKQIPISIRPDMKKSEIGCQIIQNLHFRNLETMRRIVVTDTENSEFLIYD